MRPSHSCRYSRIDGAHQDKIIAAHQALINKFDKQTYLDPKSSPTLVSKKRGQHLRYLGHPANGIVATPFLCNVHMACAYYCACVSRSVVLSAWLSLSVSVSLSLSLSLSLSRLFVFHCLCPLLFTCQPTSCLSVSASLSQSVSVWLCLALSLLVRANACRSSGHDCLVVRLEWKDILCVCTCTCLFAVNQCVVALLIKSCLL